MGRAYGAPSGRPVSGAVQAEPLRARQARHHQVVGVLHQFPYDAVREAADGDRVPVPLVQVPAGDDHARVVGAALTQVDAKVHGRSGYADAEVYHPRYGGYFRE